MDHDRAKEIIRSLADGRDPATGQPFPPNSPYQQADTVRALFIALEAMGKGKAKPAARPVDPNKPKAGGAWSPEEEQHLREAFAAHKTLPQIAAAHGRTPGAISNRLMKLGLIENTFATRAVRGNTPSSRSSSPIAPMGPTPAGPPDSPRPPRNPLPRELTEAEKDNLPF